MHRRYRERYTYRYDSTDSQGGQSMYIVYDTQSSCGFMYLRLTPPVVMLCLGRREDQPRVGSIVRASVSSQPQCGKDVPRAVRSRGVGGGASGVPSGPG